MGAPILAVYPDSDKLATVPTGEGEGEIDYLMVPRDAGVDYWYGEGDGGRLEAAEVVRQPDSAPSQPVVNALSDHVEVRLGPQLGASLLSAVVVDLDAGEESAPYHYQYGREQWVLVADGVPSVRHPEGEDALAAGDVMCFPDGPGGAHQVINRSDQVARVLFLSTTGLPANVGYPDSGMWLMRNTSDEDGVMVHPGPAQ